MHYVRSGFVVSIIAILAWNAANGVRQIHWAVAQETPQNSKPAGSPKVTQPPRQLNDPAEERPYPVFFVDDLVAVLTSNVEQLIEGKRTKNSDELRKNLDRASFTMTLPRVVTKEITPQELYRKATESTFLVSGLTKPNDSDPSWKTAFSTAFVVHEDGVLCTSAHVFDHEDHDDAVVVLDAQKKVFPIVELLAVDRRADTCLFRIDAKGLKPLPLGKDASPGTPIRVMGHPGDSFYFFSAGLVANYERDEQSQVWMNVTADFGQGSSGGPVMDAAGNVVGQVSRTYTLYSGGQTSNRRRRTNRTRQVADSDLKPEPAKELPVDESEEKKSADPQMIFKACTPVSAIRALVK